MTQDEERTARFKLDCIKEAGEIFWGSKKIMHTLRLANVLEILCRDDKKTFEYFMPGINLEIEIEALDDIEENERKKRQERLESEINQEREENAKELT